MPDLLAAIRANTVTIGHKSRALSSSLAASLAPSLTLAATLASLALSSLSAFSTSYRH